LYLFSNCCQALITLNPLKVKKILSKMGLNAHAKIILYFYIQKLMTKEIGYNKSQKTIRRNNGWTN